MKRIHLPIMHAVILVMVAWIASQFLVGCFKDPDPPRSLSDLKQQAETAIRDAGGAAAL